MLDRKKIFLVLSILTCFLFCIALEPSAMGNKRVILIDPAHGGQDRGIKLNNDASEKDITLALALSMKKGLANDHNLEVILTRDSDRTVTIEEREKMIEKVRPDFVLSLHVNGGFGKNASGFEIYHPGLNEDIVKHKKTSKGDMSQVRNKYQNDSLRMAEIVQENLKVLFPRKGRGLRKADLSITDGFQIPALLIEIGFGTNSEDKNKLLSLKTQSEISASLVRSIKSFFR